MGGDFVGELGRALRYTERILNPTLKPKDKTLYALDPTSPHHWRVAPQYIQGPSRQPLLGSVAAKSIWQGVRGARFSGGVAA